MKSNTRLEKTVSEPSTAHTHRLAVAPIALGLLAVALSSLVPTACGPVPGRTDGGVPVEQDAGRGDAGDRCQDGGWNDGGTSDAGTPDAGRLDEHGFLVRLPQVRNVPCDDECGGPVVQLRDEDSLCTLKYGSIDGFVYFQATPLSSSFVNSRFEAAAWVSVGGHVQSVPASYDYGHHHNDSLSLTYLGQAYRYYHSSFGYGGRACQSMDCLQLQTGVTVDDGCKPDRSHPIVCVAIADDGTTPLLVDKYVKCPGDPNGP